MSEFLLKIDSYKDGILKESIEKHICTKIEEKNEVGQISSKNSGRMFYVHLRMVCMDSPDFLLLLFWISVSLYNPECPEIHCV